MFVIIPVCKDTAVCIHAETLSILAGRDSPASMVFRETTNDCYVDRERRRCSDLTGDIGLLNA